MSLLLASAHALPLVDECVQCCVTSPPYWGLRDYGVPPLVWGGDLECEHEWGEAVAVNATNHTDKRRWNHARNGRGEDQPVEKRPGWKRQTITQGQFCQLCGAWCGALGLEPTPDLYIAHLVMVFEEVRRVLKPDGVLWMNLGDCYATGAGKVGEHPGGAQGERWKGYKGDRDGHEGKHGYRVGPQTQPNRLPIPGLKAKDLVGVPWMAAFALRSAGWYLRSDVIWSKPNPMPESVTDRPTKAHEYIFLLSKSERYYYDAAAIREPYSASTLQQFEQGYDGQATKEYGGTWAQNPSDVKRRIVDKQRGHGRRHAGFNDRWDAMPKDEQCIRGANKRSVWTVATRPYPDAHFATFPDTLIEPCILAGSRPNDRVLDPFIGTGTVGQVSERLMRRWVGTDLGYQKLAKRRTAQRGLRLDEASA
jgi:DNA modification methylase